MTSRALLALLPVLATALLGVPAATAQERPLDEVVPGTRVVVVGAPGLRWEDVDPTSTPTLHRLADEAAVGVLSVKALPTVSCPADGWLTLGAGARAEADGVPCGTLAVEAEDVEGLAAGNLETRDAADVRALTEALRGVGLCLAARGDGAELAGGDPGRACPVLLVDAPAVSGDAGERTSAAAGVDEVVAAVEASLSPGSTLLVVGLSGAPGEDRARLHVAVAVGPGLSEAGLVSASTRRVPYVQLIDVAPTVLDLLGIEPPRAMTGQPWQTSGPAPDVAALADLDRRAVAATSSTVPFFVLLVGGLLLALALARWRRSWRAAELIGLAGVALLGGSYLAGLLPWWRLPVPLAGLVVVTAAVGGLVTAAAVRLRGRLTAAGAVCAGLAVLLLVDLVTGARLQTDAPAGYSPLVAGRFAGLGNVGFGVLAGALLLALAALTAGRTSRQSLAAVAAGGALAVLVVGAPPFGSDVGGVLALTPAVVLLAMLRGGRRVTLSRLLAGGFAGAALVTLLALLDFSRPAAQRTHLGRFLEDVRDGEAAGVLTRKAAAIGDLLLANPATAMLPLVLALAVWLVVRPPASLRRVFTAAPAWRHGLLAVGAASLVGLVVNDSGPAIPALALLVAAPATVAVCARVATDPAAPASSDG
ncbi:MAG TPA: hypothetical protein VM433_08070 [Mycobacteriales bacterium]|nr:hypothetical protein [Mycobacteriales bacterium]